MSSRQQTLAGEATMSGVGLHTGNDSTMTIKPAAENTGFVFVRTDLPGNPEVPALVDHVVSLARGTTIAVGDADVHTVEHVLAALVGMGIDNCRIELTNNEPPIGDGSAQPYVDMIKRAGVVEQGASRQELVITDTIRYVDEQRGTEIVALPNPEYRVTVMVDYNNPALGSQHTGLFNLEAEFEKEFAPARTFCFLHEVEMLHEAGLIKGGNLENAIVIIDEDLTAEDLEKTVKKLNISDNALLGTPSAANSQKLRFRNEPARHKLLDMIGDLALVGARITGQVLAARPGHASNIAFARLLREEYKKQRKGPWIRSVDTTTTHFNCQDILRIMPHRYPFLLVDRIIEFDEVNKRILGLKNISFNEPQFMGHFPGRPIFPGVLITEAMAQTGCMLLLAEGMDVSQKLVVFTGMNNVKFRKEVNPGDQLLMDVKLIKYRFNIVQLEARAYVGSTLVAEADLSAAVVDREVK
ncbi:MAG: bifunctional UDP-3-O-[3-hydroxymyristoyl] N-acetylglucosamine deacetylase/3-hydroxyacyl-ACP dehydratase [Bradyrhizobiaceae bacterium]|nr:bifunctional UDP-3-O-[3-hydroxymyristoyl] N-acetylglucosamine deacetylase/3-hydroxyacyl-ACP dehydratase [Bradyrhizobiaceae bacterium]